MLRDVGTWPYAKRMTTTYAKEQARVEHLCASAALAASRRALTTAIQWGDAQVVAMLRLQVAEYERQLSRAQHVYFSALAGTAPALTEDAVEL